MANCNFKEHQDPVFYWTEQEIKEDFYFEAIDDAEFIIDDHKWEKKECGIHYIQI